MLDQDPAGGAHFHPARFEVDPDRLGFVRSFDAQETIDTEPGRGWIPVIPLDPSTAAFRNVLDGVDRPDESGRGDPCTPRPSPLDWHIKRH